MMITENYLKFLAALKSNTAITLLPGFTDEALKVFPEAGLKRKQKSIKDIAGIEMMDRDLVYFQLSSVSVAWVSNMPGRILSGGFRMNGLTDALCFPGQFWKAEFSLSEGSEAPEHLKHFETLNWFERSADGTGNALGCFVRRQGCFSPPVAFYYRGWYTELTLDFEGYLEKMFDTYAVSGWQFFYIDIPQNMPGVADVLSDMRTATELLPLVFPDRDWGYHISRYNEALERLGKR